MGLGFVVVTMFRHEKLKIFLMVTTTNPRPIHGLHVALWQKQGKIFLFYNKRGKNRNRFNFSWRNMVTTTNPRPTQDISS